MVIKYDPHGLHFAELFNEPDLTDLLPGLMPSDGDMGAADEWDEALVRSFPHLGEDE